jgi:hypothetical protein
MATAENETPIKSYTKTEMAIFYNVSYTAFIGWVKRLEKDLINQHGYDPNQKIFTIAQVRFLFDKLGRP